MSELVNGKGACEVGNHGFEAEMEVLFFSLSFFFFVEPNTFPVQVMTTLYQPCSTHELFRNTHTIIVTGAQVNRLFSE